jgi:fatty acid desaturase
MFQELIAYAHSHNVDPLIFIIIYLASFPFYYLPLLKIKKFYDSRKDKKELGREVLASIIINRFAWAAPYGYVMIWGKGLPAWIYMLVSAYLLFGAIYFVYSMRVRSKKSEN